MVGTYGGSSSLTFSRRKLVLDEAADGEPAKAAERLQLLAGIPLLDLNETGSDARQKAGFQWHSSKRRWSRRLPYRRRRYSSNGFSTHLELQNTSPTHSSPTGSTLAFRMPGFIFLLSAHLSSFFTDDNDSEDQNPEDA